MVNPFSVVDAGSAFIGASKSLADIANTDAQAEYHRQQAAKLKGEAEEQEALKQAFAAEAASGQSPFTATNSTIAMPGADASDSPLAIFGQAPTFPKMFEMAAKYDKDAKKFGAISPTYGKDLLKRRDELLAKASDDQRQWVEKVGKNIEDINKALGGITGAPTYNATMQELVATHGKGILKRLGLPPSITQQEYENNPEYADKVQAIRQRGYSLKDQLDDELKKQQLAQQEAHNKALEEDARLRRVAENTRIELERNRIAQADKHHKENLAQRDEARIAQDTTRVQTRLDATPEAKKFPSYQQAISLVETIQGKLMTPEGTLKPNGYQQIGQVEALQLKSYLAKMMTDYKDSYSTVYGEKQMKEVMGMFQKADAYLSTVGEGSKQWDDKTLKQVIDTMNFSYRVANDAMVKKDLAAVESVARRGGDPERLMLKGDFPRFLRQNYNPKNPTQSFVNFAKEDTDDGPVYWMRYGTGASAQKFQVTKRMYDYAQQQQSR